MNKLIHTKDAQKYQQRLKSYKVQFMTLEQFIKHKELKDTTWSNHMLHEEYLRKLLSKYVTYIK